MSYHTISSPVEVPGLYESTVQVTSGAHSTQRYNPYNTSVIFNMMDGHHDTFTTEWSRLSDQVLCEIVTQLQTFPHALVQLETIPPRTSAQARAYDVPIQKSVLVNLEILLYKC